MEPQRKKVAEHHHNPGLVGRIVEKGFASDHIPRSPLPSPQPSALPFPVARHRSHGPHWAPVGTLTSGSEEEFDDDRDETNYDPIALLAKPPRKRERKGLDFSRWRDFVNEKPIKDGSFDAPKVKSEVKKVSERVVNDSKLGKEEVEVRRGGGDSGSSHVVVGVNGSDRAGDSGAAVVAGKMEGVGDVKGGGLETSLPVSGTNVYGRMEVDIADEIDAENLARLGHMLPEEIAEAQAEIMGRMSPAVLEMLKNRGRDKMESKGGGGVSSKDDVKKEKRDGGGEALNGKVKGSKKVERTEVSSSGEATRGVSEFRPSGGHDGTAWHAWAERVEKVREFRFSLDGNAMTSDGTGERNGCNQYNPENVTERDYLRTEGDPAAAGYTIKEAVALVRSMVPAQRSFALHLLASVFDKALSNMQSQSLRCSESTGASYDFVDWQAVWAYALGPEPEMALVLRIALDDNHNSVVLACAKVIQYVLCCDINEKFFDISEKSSVHETATWTAPIFRTRPEIGCGFLHGGYWKYNTKLSNILATQENVKEDEDQEQHTIGDDVIVAGQDMAAGLVRMGVLPRICYLLEMDPSPPLDECLVSILVGLAGHSLTCSNAVMKCPRLVQTVVDRLSMLTSLENLPFQMKSVMLLKVLSDADRQNCTEFISRGIFQRAMSQLYRNALSLYDSSHVGIKQCKLTSSLMIQQLRFWKTCIRYGYCISYFADFFPALCFWLSTPSFETLAERNVLGEFLLVATEAFLVLEALSQRLPSVHSVKQIYIHESTDTGKELWSWSHVAPMVDLAVKWLQLQNIPNITSGGNRKSDANGDCSLDFHVLWVISAVMHMLSTIINRIAPEQTSNSDKCGPMPWLPDFVPKIGLAIVKGGFLKFGDSGGRILEGRSAMGSSLVAWLCQVRHHNIWEASLASSCCLHWLVELIISVDKSIQRAKASSHVSLEQNNSSLEDNILTNGITKSGKDDLIIVLDELIGLAGSRWQVAHSMETFDRGGPAPGLGFGWGSLGGGFWSAALLQSQADARLLQSLYTIFPIIVDDDIAVSEVAGKLASDWPVNDALPILQKINSVIWMSLVSGPSDRLATENTLDILFQTPVLRFLDICIHLFLHSVKKFEPPNWQFSDEDYLRFSKALDAHYRTRWLSSKVRPRNRKDGNNLDEKSSEKSGVLETIPEDVEILVTTNACQKQTSLRIEWAHQRLPLPRHWLLSPLCTVMDYKTAQALHGSTNMKSKETYVGDPTEVVKSGIFLLLGLEATSYFLMMKSIHSPIVGIPLVWKLHALSMMLIIKSDVLDDLRFRTIFETLQNLYGQHLQQPILENAKPGLPSHRHLESCQSGKQSLNFQKEVHESYSNFIETFVEHFASISYGDVAFGRQIAIYLHRSVDDTVRLAAWNALSNAHVLELLPPLQNCISEAGGYLEPIEDNESILEAYVKSWTSGSLDRAAKRESISFTLSLHHLSGFIFCEHAPDKLLLQYRIVKSLLRGSSRKPDQEGMMLDLIKYDNSNKEVMIPTDDLRKRFTVLSKACEGNSSLLAELEKLKSLAND